MCRIPYNSRREQQRNPQTNARTGFASGNHAGASACGTGILVVFAFTATAEQSMDRAAARFGVTNRPRTPEGSPAGQAYGAAGPQHAEPLGDEGVCADYTERRT